jgi:hypothetical protein
MGGLSCDKGQFAVGRDRLVYNKKSKFDGIRARLGGRLLRCGYNPKAYKSIFRRRRMRMIKLGLKKDRKYFLKLPPYHKEYVKRDYLLGLGNYFLRYLRRKKIRLKQIRRHKKRQMRNSKVLSNRPRQITKG